MKLKYLINIITKEFHLKPDSAIPRWASPVSFQCLCDVQPEKGLRSGYALLFVPAQVVRGCRDEWDRAKAYYPPGARVTMPAHPSQMICHPFSIPLSIIPPTSNTNLDQIYEVYTFYDYVQYFISLAWKWNPGSSCHLSHTIRTTSRSSLKWAYLDGISSNNSISCQWNFFR